MPQHILIVEDEPAIADTIHYALQTEGFAVSRCDTGEAARRMLAGQDFSLMLLDVGLPDCNGFDLCREARKTSAIPIVFLTARGDEVDRIVGLELGADDYVAKPFSPRELSARVRAILRRCQAPEAQPETNAFALEDRTCEVRYFGQRLPLSPGEYRLLSVLIERIGWVLSREQLLALAWEDPASCEVRTIDTHIKTIRKKLQAVRPGANPIRTHHGMGYSLQSAE